jgi:3-phosphoshikimate 1-carboxyvinyltransferase
VIGENAEESPYVRMTHLLLRYFQEIPGKFWIEPDASSSSYLKASAWLLSEHIVNPLTKVFSPSITILEPNLSLQVDRQFHNYFQKFGCIRHVRDNSEEQVIISRSNDLGDSIMTAVVMTPFSENTVKFTDLGRLRLQETERVVALRTELTKCGAKVIEEGDTLTVYPSKLHGAEIETYNDHRMAMCFAILGLKVPGIKLTNPACVKKTFPNFFQKLAAVPPHGLGATILDAKTGRKLSHDELFAD